MHMASAGQLARMPSKRGEGSDPRARLPGQRVGIGAARPDLGGESAETAVRVRDDFELFLLKLDGQHTGRGEDLPLGRRGS